MRRNDNLDFLVDDVDRSHVAVCFLAVRQAANLLRVYGEAAVSLSNHVEDFKAVNQGVGLNNDVNTLMLTCSACPCGYRGRRRQRGGFWQPLELQPQRTGSGRAA